MHSTPYIYLIFETLPGVWNSCSLHFLPEEIGSMLNDKDGSPAGDPHRGKELTCSLATFRHVS
jgi:hypothetical protein